MCEQISSNFPREVISCSFVVIGLRLELEAPKQG